jgi:DNA-binding transcriptional ArsR family regulator
MPLILDDPQVPDPRILIHGSTAIELSWALASAEQPDYQRDHPPLGRVYASHPELGQRVRSFWDPGLATSCGGYLELMVLAHHGNVLFTLDAEKLFGGLGQLCATSPADLPLASETEADRTAVLARLADLRASAERRQEYVDLLRDVWAAVGEVWEREGRRAVDTAIASRRQLLHRGGSWSEISRADYDYGGLLPRLVAALGPTDELAVVPAYFTHRGLLVDLPGVLVVGVPARLSGAEARARTELLARRLKTISDPTRLAILDTLTGGAATVTEIAAAFGLAQPTVSNHIKLLRDAGLITNARTGSRRDLIVDSDAVAELLDDLHTVLRQPAG